MVKKHTIDYSLSWEQNYERLDKHHREKTAEFLDKLRRAQGLLRGVLFTHNNDTVTLPTALAVKLAQFVDGEARTKGNDNVKKYDPDSKETDAEFLRDIVLMFDFNSERSRRARKRLHTIAHRLEAIDDAPAVANANFRAWMIKHDSHGLALDTLVMVPEGIAPEGIAPETHHEWVRVPWLDSTAQREPQHPNHDGIFGAADLEGRGLPNQLDDHFTDDHVDVLVTERFDSTSDSPVTIDFVEAQRFVAMLRESADFIRDEIIADADHERGNDHPGLTLVEPRLREAATRIERAANLANDAPAIGFAVATGRIVRALNGADPEPK